jgi:hypothetical protein
MEKILNDRLNHLKSDLADLTKVKLTKDISKYETKILIQKGKIEELEWLIYKFNKQ